MGATMDERLVYLIPYFFVSACNWLQGPYFYAVYKTKFAPEDVENQLKNIYICGYSMSLLSSIFAGFWTDKLGRKGASICCCMLYVCSCMSVYSNSITLLYGFPSKFCLCCILALITCQGYVVVDANIFEVAPIKRGSHPLNGLFPSLVTLDFSSS